MSTTDDGIPADLRRDPTTNTSAIAPKATAPATPAPKPEPKRTGRVLPSLKAPVVEATPAPKATKPAKKAKVAKAAKPAKGKAIAAAHKPTQVERTEGNPQKSIVPARFKAAYAAHDDTSGTALTLELKKYTTTKNADGRPCLDLKALAEVAKENGLDIKGYDGLNNGQKRMNVYNRLRGKLRGGNPVVIGKRKFADAAKALAVQAAE